MPGAFCQACGTYYEWPYGKTNGRRKLKDYPCPKCGAPGRFCPRGEEAYKQDREKLKAWQEWATQGEVIYERPGSR